MAEKGITDSELVGMGQKLTGAAGAVIIKPSDVETAAWVRLKCQFGCDGYGQCLVCPPYTPTPEQMRGVLDGYQRAVLVQFTDYADTKEQMSGFERAVFLRGAWKALGLGAGPCLLCQECPLKPGSCLHAEKARPAMEACGIDVYTTVRRAGLPIEVVRNRRQCPHYYGLLLVD
jgi:predicted metal-binding protein